MKEKPQKLNLTILFLFNKMTNILKNMQCLHKKKNNNVS